MSYRYQEHISDIRLVVCAKDPQTLFFDALKGMNALIKKHMKKSTHWTESQIIKVRSLDETSLLIDFLSEVLSLTHIHHTIYFKMDVEKLSKTHLIAKIYGKKVEGFDIDIKGVTHHEAQITKTNANEYQVTVVFDI